MHNSFDQMIADEHHSTALTVGRGAKDQLQRLCAPRRPLNDFSSNVATETRPAAELDSPIIDLGLSTDNTTITLQLCGESFSYTLKSLSPDPLEIIQLLKLTTSERGNWILVGAYYRRSGNTNAAVKVMTAMLEGKYRSHNLKVHN